VEEDEDQELGSGCFEGQQLELDLQIWEQELNQVRQREVQDLARDDRCQNG
jgi:hypothetical protein